MKITSQTLIQFILIVLVAGIFLGLCSPAFALETPGVVRNALNPLPSDLDPAHRIAVVVNWLMGIVATVTVLLIIIAGIRYITSAGETDIIESAKRTIKYAIMGLVISILAIIIVNVVVNLID